MSVFDFVTSFYTLTVTGVIVVVTIIHYKRKYSVWSKRGVAGPTPIPILGTTTDGYFHSIPDIFVKNSRKYGRIYGYYDAFGPILVVSDPKLIKQVMVKDFHLFTNRREFKHLDEVVSKMMSVAVDSEWKRLRKVVSPTFSTGKIKRMKPLMEACISNATEFLDLTAAKKEELNVKQFWSRFTLEVIARCCFATNVNSHTDPDNEFFRHVTNFFVPPNAVKLIILTLFLLLPSRLLMKIPLRLFKKEDLDFLSNVTRHLIKQRRDENSDQNDFLQLLIEAEKENEDKSEPPLTENEIIANSILFFLAGYETTANLLNWISYSLAMNPTVQDKLYEEISGHFPDTNSIDYDVANKLPYLDAVVSETLRMYPPAVVTERTASAEVELEGTGITVPAKTVVQIPLFSIQRDPEFFPQPELFNPERFMGDNRENIDPYAYLPFGAGPRNCVAMRFALIEAKLAIIHTVLNFKIARSNKTPEKPEFLKFTTFTVSKDIFVNVIKR